MSIALIDAVFRTDLPATRKLIMLALADNANDSGFCWPNQETVASKASISVRNLRTHLHGLEADGWFSVLTLGNGRGRSSEYLLNVSRIKAEKADPSVIKADPDELKADIFVDKGGSGDPTNRHRTVRSSTVIEPLGKTTIDQGFVDEMETRFPRLDVAVEYASYLNRPASKINAHPDQRLAFLNWLKKAESWLPEPKSNGYKPAKVNVGQRHTREDYAGIANVLFVGDDDE